MGKKDIQFNLRIPEELKNKVDAAAKANQRSINAEATSRLYDSFVMNDKGYGSTIIMFLLVIVMLITIAQLYFQKKWVHYQ